VASGFLIRQEIQSDTDAIQQNEALFREANFVDRAEAEDFIEFHVIGRIESTISASRQIDGLVELKRHAMSLKDRLEEIDEKLFRKLRASIRSGTYTSEDQKRQFDMYLERASEWRSQDDIGYDSLDSLLNGLLRIDVIPEETRTREPEMVSLQPTPARVVLEMIEKAEITEDDGFYDLGSGLGQVPILVHLLTGARAKGIEFEPAYCDYARRCARELNLSGVEFMNVDARDASYSGGTVFFMYTPFRGKLLEEVLGRLQDESRTRTIRICTYGPCSLQMSDRRWLEHLDQEPIREHRLAAFRSITEA